MELKYLQKRNGMYILCSSDFDDIATLVLNEHCPSALQRPMTLNIDYIINECFFLTQHFRYLSEDGSVLGMMAFGDILVKCKNQLRIEEKFEAKTGSMIIDLSLPVKHQYERLRFTKAHETSHWILHRSYHDPSHKKYELRTVDGSIPEFVACRSSRKGMRSFKSSSKSDWTDNDWEEWQADKLASSLLMPRETFREKAIMTMRRNGVYCGHLIASKSGYALGSTLETVAHCFSVSKTAAAIRMKQLGLLYENEKEAYYSLIVNH